MQQAYRALKQLFGVTPKIEVFVRHCHFSKVSEHKARLPNFSRQRCHENLLSTLDSKKANITFLLDTFHPSQEPHFVLQQKEYPVIQISEGSETGSFLKLLDHVISLNLSDDTICYFLEDDYIHKNGWVDILYEGFTLPNADYITLYDHRDKYFLYPDLASKIYHTASCHWRTTPSTTNTYAMKYKTLKRDLEVHREFSLNRKISADHDKFSKLTSQGATLLSSIPGWSTHAEPDYASPCTAWETLLN